MKDWVILLCDLQAVNDNNELWQTIADTLIKIIYVMYCQYVIKPIILHRF